MHPQPDRPIEDDVPATLSEPVTSPGDALAVADADAPDAAAPAPDEATGSAAEVGAPEEAPALEAAPDEPTAPDEAAQRIAAPAKVTAPDEPAAPDEAETPEEAAHSEPPEAPVAPEPAAPEEAPAPEAAPDHLAAEAAAPEEAAHSQQPEPPEASEPAVSVERAATADTPAPAPAAPGTVAELIAASLRASGVRTAFTVPGESFLPILDALEAVGIRVVATRHEGAAAFAAEAYGQLTGRPALCLGTRAVGAANLAIGIHTATADSTPMFAIVGQVTAAIAGREAFQEADVAGSVGRLAKWAGDLDDPARAADVLEAATRAALEGRPGPAVLVVPEDVQAMPIPEGTRVPVIRPRAEPPSASDVRAVLDLLAGAERPVILAGAGVLRARCSNDLVRLAELLHVPVVASWRRGDVIPNDHPLYLGMTGFGSPATVRRRIEAADALLVVGSRLSEPTTAGYRIPVPGQRWIHVDLEPRTSAVGDTPAPELAIRADARAFIRAAVARLKDAVLLAEPIAARDRHNPEDRAAWEASTIVDDTAWDGPGVHPGRIVAMLQRLLPEDTIVTTDAGAFAGWAARGFRFRRPGTFIGPTSGAMGYGLPAAIAAAIVHRERRVVALLGDGGLGMTLAELETAVREEAHVVAIVFDNASYGMIRAHQAIQGSPTLPGTNLGPLDFAAVARACGARGVRVDTDAGFEPALRTALAAAGPSVIQLAVDPRWVSVDDHPGTQAGG